MSSSSSKSSANSPQNLNYYGTLAGAICWGPIDWLTAVIYNGDYLWQCPSSGPLDLTAEGAVTDEGYVDLTGSLLNPNLFISGGYFYIYRGVPNQTPNPVLVGHPGYDDSAYVLLNGIFFGQGSGTAPNIQVICGRVPRVPTTIVAAADNVANDRQVNPIAALAELLTDERGKNFPVALIDTTSWLAAAHWCAQDQAHMDYSFVSPLITDQTAMRDIVKALLDPINGFLYWTPAGLLGCQIYEWGTNPGGLQTLDARYFTKAPKFVHGDWTDIPTEIVVSFTDRAYEFQQNTVLVPNTRAALIRQVTDQAQLDRSHVTRSPQAQSQGQEYNTRVGQGPGTGEISIRGPIVQGILPGTKVLVDVEPEPSSEALGQLARVDKIQLDRSDEAVLNLTLDPLLPAAPYSPTWTSPLPESTFAATVESGPSLAHMQAIPLPPDTFGWPPSVGFLATRSSPQQCGFNAYFATNPAAAFALLGNQVGFAARVSLVNAIGSGDSPIELQLLDGADGPDAYLAANTPGGNTVQAEDDFLLAVLLQLDGDNRVAIDGGGNPIMEFCSIEQRAAITSTEFNYTVLRGRCSLPALAWPAGTLGWIVPKANIVGWQQNLFSTLLGSPAYFRLAAYTSAAVNESSPLPETDMVFPAAYAADQPATYTVSLSSDAATIACNSSGTPLSGQLGTGGTANTVVTVLQNGVPLTAVSGTPTEGEFSISLGTVTNATAAIVGTNEVQADSLSASSGTIQINVLVGGAFTVSKTYTLSQALQGNTGATGTTGDTQVTIYTVNALQPSTPTGSSPAGWSTALPAPVAGEAIWASTGTFNPSGSLVGSWSTPQRISGNIVIYSSTQPSPSSTNLMAGDTWFNLSTPGEIYYWSGTSWVGATGPILSTNGSGQVNGINTIGSGTSPFVILASEFQVWNGTAPQAPFTIIGGTTYITDAFIYSLDAGKLTAGTIEAAVSLGSLGSLSSGSGASALYNDQTGTAFGDVSGVHFKFEDGSSGVAQLSIYNGSTLVGLLYYSSGAAGPMLNLVNGQIYDLASCTSQFVGAYGTSDPRSGSAPLISLGGAYVTKSLDVGANFSVAGTAALNGTTDINGAAVFGSSGTATFNGVAGFNANCNITGTNSLIFANNPSLTSYLLENWGVQIHGDSTHPVQVPDAALAMFNAGGSSLTPGYFYLGASTYVWADPSTGALMAHTPSSGDVTLAA